MSAELVGFLLLIALLAVWYLEVMPPVGASLVIRIRGASLRVVRGGVRSHVVTDLTDILRPARLTRGFIALNDNQRVIFSRNIPAELHQQLRNVLVNR